ncbi:MAG: hypothetical protein B7C24_16900, partial [Bacteroidetes bacterium 4572_77]
MPIDLLIKKAKSLGMDKLALTDINNTTGLPDFIKAAKEANIKPIAGVDVRNSNQFLYHYQLQHKSYPTEAPKLKEVFIIYPLHHFPQGQLQDNEFIGVRKREINQLYRYKNKPLLKRMLI